MGTLQKSYQYGKPLVSTSQRTSYNTYIFGSHISGSLSPLVHGILFRSMGLPWSFHLVQTTDKFKFLDTLADPETAGVSITMPHKITFGSLLDDQTEEARVIGAVNTTFARIDETGKRR